MIAYDEAGLSGITILADLAPAEVEELGRRCRWRRYDAGQRILGHLDRTQDVYFIVEGVVRATAYSLAGKEVQYRDIGSGEVFGEYSAIDSEVRSADVVAQEDCLVASLPAEAFRKVLYDRPEVAMATLSLLTRQIRILTERVFEFSTLGAKNRLHAELLRLAREHLRDDNTAAILSVPTHADIAHRIASHREAVSREMKAMERAGLVERRGSTIAVPDITRLERLVREVLGDQL